MTTHSHCPGGCEHPQPFWWAGPNDKESRLVCGRCFFKYGEVVEMVPCTPETCDGETGDGR